MFIYFYFLVIEGGFGIFKVVVGGIFGVYGGLVYLLMIFGVWIVDCLFGVECVLFVSVMVIVVGYFVFVLIFGVVGVGVGFVFVVFGFGGLKVNVILVVGSFYSVDDLC